MKPEVFRPTAALRWIFAVLCSLMISGSLAPLFDCGDSRNGSPPWGVRLGIPFFVGLPSLFFLYWLWRERIVADADGLRGVKRAFYEEIGRLGISDTFFLETRDGRRPVKWFLNIADAHELRLEMEKRTGLRFLSAEGVEQAKNPAEQPDQIQQKLEGGHAGR